MSDAVFPQLIGLDWQSSKAPQFNSKVMTSVNGRELRASYQAVPVYKIKLSYSFLRESQGRDELRQLEGFFLARRGSFDSFLLAMPDDCNLSGERIGTSNGTQTTYHAQRAIGPVVVPLLHVDGARASVEALMYADAGNNAMWSNASRPMWLQPAAVSSAGVVTLSVAPKPGKVILLNCTYYYRCRFKDDSQEFENFMHNLWQAKKVEMVGCLGDKI
jgi:hypothetical protein